MTKEGLIKELEKLLTKVELATLKEYGEDIPDEVIRAVYIEELLETLKNGYEQK